MSARLAVEIPRRPAPPAGSRASQARAAARRCRASCSGSSIRARSTRSQPGCRTAPRSSPPRTARRRRPRWPPRSSSRGTALAWNRSGANLVSGVASTLLDAARRRARTARGGRGRAPRGRAPRAAARRAARQPLPRPARPLRRARAHRRALASGDRGACRRTRCSSSTATTRRSATSARDRAGTIAFGIDDPRTRPAGAAARGRLALLRPLRPAVRVRGRVRRPPRRLPLPRLRPRPARARRCGRARSSSTGSRASRFELETPAGTTRVRLPLPGLYNVYNALGAAALAQVARRAARRDPGRARAVRRRVRPLRADRGRRQDDPGAADQEPRRRERGRPHARARRCARRCSSSR